MQTGAIFPHDRSGRQLNLHTRVGLVLTALAASLLLVLGGLWLHGARSGVHEEVEAATRVSEQWLRVVDGELRRLPPAERADRLLEIVSSIGRVRSSVLELRGNDGQLRYASPPPSYKAGRSAPRWFAGLLAADLPVRRIDVAGQPISLYPDASRAVLDAWDELLAMAGWAGLLLLAMFLATRTALARALRPLDQVMQALDRTAAGRFDFRLPAFATPELDRLARAYNGMADRLTSAVDDNVRLETEREVAQQMHARLTDERRLIARELHDELAQGITAVRALAGAIVQRTGEQAALHSHARSIVAVTGEMQEGVRHILHRLRPPAECLDKQFERLLGNWRRQHGEIALHERMDLGLGNIDAEMAQTAMRVVQEGLTNVVRHSGADRVELAIDRIGAGLQILVADNGRGGAAGQPGCGLGLTGMRERIALVGGEMSIEYPAGGGFRLLVRLPVSDPALKESP